MGTSNDSIAAFDLMSLKSALPGVSQGLQISGTSINELAGGPMTPTFANVSPRMLASDH
jgi:hypothetical protein